MGNKGRRLTAVSVTSEGWASTMDPETGKRGQDRTAQKRMTPVPGPFGSTLRRGAIDRRSKEGRFLAAARYLLIQHLGGQPSATQLVLVDRVAWLMLHCLLLDRRMVSAKQDWGENDRKCYLAFSNALVRTLREIGLEGNPARQPTLAEVLKAERVA